MSLPRTAHGTPEGPAAVTVAGLLPTAAAADMLFKPGGQIGEAVPSPKPLPSALDRAPVEVLVDVFQHLDLQAAFSLAATNKRLDNIFARNRAVIVLHIVQREFSPLNGLLQVVKASPADLAVPWGTWLDKRIRRKNVVLCPGGVLGVDRRTSGSLAASLVNVRCAEAEITNADIDRILDVCRIVRGWERIFPQHRFNASPLLTRSLSARENFRLRRALYNWMRYAYYFHGDLPRPNVFVPAGRDVRINQLRALGNSQLGELTDLWRTVEDIIELSLCPSVDIIRIGAVCFLLSPLETHATGWLTLIIGLSDIREGCGHDRLGRAAGEQDGGGDHVQAVSRAAAALPGQCSQVHQDAAHCGHSATDALL